ncbi:MAG: hypothetical protein KKF56_05385 [Nanoarchaeota archaeon]|nr:hypothetical protein [Nanoarchaeota archaeon]
MALKTKNLVAMIIIGVFVLGIIGLLFFINKDNGLNISTSGLQASGSYECLSGYTCEATPILKCINPTSEERIVIARVQDFNYGENYPQHWIALANEYGNLESWTYSSLVIHSVTLYLDYNPQYWHKDFTLFDLPYDREGFFTTCSIGSDKCLYVIQSASAGKYYMYKQRTGADINPEQLYNCEGRELCSGTQSMYSCSKTVTTNTETQTLSWNRDYPTPTEGYKPYSFFLDGDTENNLISFSGEIEYTRTIKLPEPITECTASNGEILSIGQQACSIINSNILEKCISNINTGNAELKEIPLIGDCCESNSDCNDNNPATNDVCSSNSCLNIEIEDFCATSSDCPHQDQSCQNNACIFPTTGDYCSASQLGTKKCIGSVLQKCIYFTGWDNAYIWGFEQDCGESDKVCVSSGCITYGTVNFNTEDSYGVGKEIIIKPLIYSSQSLSGKSAKIILLQQELFSDNYQVIEQKLNLGVLFDNSLSEVKFNGLTRSGKIKFELTIFDTSLPDKEINFTSDEIEIKPSLKISPSISPQVTNTGQDLSVSLIITDENGDSITSPIGVSVIIQLGLNTISPSYTSSSEIRFNPVSFTGFALITITAEATGYVRAEESIQTEIIKSNIAQKVKVDGINYESLDEGRINVGSRKISVGIEKGGVAMKLDSISLEMQRPDSGFDSLTFTPNYDKTEWSATYNFLEEHKTYTLIGVASDFTNGVEYDINPSFSTVGGTVDCNLYPEHPDCKGGIPFWVWIIGGVVLLGIIIGIIIAVRRR